jgi:hypothetical protein
MQEGIAGLSTLETADLNPADVDFALRTATNDSRELLGALGVGFEEGDASDEERHGAMVAALNWVGDTGADLGLAAAPLTGGTSVLAGLGVNAALDVLIGAFADATAPEASDGETFVDDVRPAVEELTGGLLYANPDVRAALVADSGSSADPTTITYDDFLALDKVTQVIGSQGDTAQAGTLLEVLRNGYYRA